MYLTKIIELNLARRNHPTSKSDYNEESCSQTTSSPSSKVYISRPPLVTIRYERLDQIRQECNCDKISIITFVGKSQTGKTFLIKNLINSNVEESKCQYDYGIWLSSKPIYTFESKNGDKTGVFVMDTSGLLEGAIVNDFILSFAKKVSSIIVINMFANQTNWYKESINSKNIIYVLHDYKNESLSTNDVQFIGLPYPGITVREKKSDINAVTNDFRFMVDNLFITLIKNENVKKILLDWNELRTILRKYSQSKNLNEIKTSKRLKFLTCNVI